MTNIKFEIDHHPKAQDDQSIKDGIIQFNSNILQEKASHFSIFVKNEDKIIGGALIWEHSDALYIDTLWIAEAFRQQKLGSKLLSMIEEQANNNQLSKIFVDTFAFQAQDFYLKHGFEVIGKAPGYLLGHDRIFLCRIIHLVPEKHTDQINNG